MKNFFLISIILFLFISCSKNIDKKELVGKWKRPDTGLYFEFLDNNIALDYEPQGVVPGNYTLSEKNMIEITFPNPGPSGIRQPAIKGKVEIKNDVMTITDAENKTVMKMERIMN